MTYEACSPPAHSSYLHHEDTVDIMKMSYKEGADLIEQINQAANTQIEKNKEEKEEKA